jgi:hypothetical protein
MTRSEQALTAERLREVLYYEGETGDFTWRRKISRKVVPGEPAGWVNDQGYRLISLFTCTYRAHRLAWLYTYGQWPTGEVDHRNGTRADNRLANLRQATSTQNKANMKVRADNRSGERGVCWDSSRKLWSARVQVNGVTLNLGRFKNFKDAVEVRRKKAKEVFGEFAR